jgi:hypothetical protein
MNLQGVARHNRPVVLAVCVSLLVTLSVRGQDAPARQDEIKVVARISKKFIEDVAAREEIKAAVPYDAIVLGFRCRGVIEGRAKLSVVLTTDQEGAAFFVNSQGNAWTYARGVRGPIVAAGPAWGPFASRTQVRFDGRKFSLVETKPWAQVHGKLECVEGRHGGPVGRAVGRVALPLGQHLIPRAEAEATPIGEYYLKNFVDGLAQQIVTKLDEKTPIEKSMTRLFPQTADWVFQMSADSQFMQAAFGPRGAKVPDLPANPGHLKDVRLQLWVHSTATEARDLAKLSEQPLAKTLVHKYVESILPELAGLAENRSLDAVGPWLVISIGAPKAE